MLKFDNCNKLLFISNESKSFNSLTSRAPLLLWYEAGWSTIFLRKEAYKDNFEAKLFISCLIQDLQLFRDKIFKDCLVIGKFSFVQINEVKLWRKELCSKPILRVDVIYNNNEIQVIRSYISPKDYRDKFCLKYTF